jgi:hypothetical protein
MGGFYLRLFAFNATINVAAINASDKISYNVISPTSFRKSGL